MERKTIRDIAADEGRSINALLSKAVPPESPVTVFMHYPIADLAQDGLLVDVGPPIGDPNQPLPWQSASSGRTGEFMKNGAEFALTHVPVRQRITKKDVESFASANPPEIRQQLTAIERKRYPNVGWGAGGLPPEGAYIHHLSLTPPVFDLRACRLPMLGVISALSKDKDETRRVSDRLIRTAHVAGLECLQTRIKVLLGDRLKALSVFFTPNAITLNLSENIYELAFPFLLAHHWFYPYDPAAAIALLKLVGGDRARLNAIYAALGWTPAMLNLEDGGRDLRQLLDVVADDLVQIASYSRTQRPVHDSRAGLARCLATALMALAENLMYVRDRMAAEREFEPAEQHNDNYVALITPHAQIPIEAPAFKVGPLMDNFKTSLKNSGKAQREKLLELLAPGDHRQGEVRIPLSPEYVITDIRGTTPALRFGYAPYEKDKQNKLVRMYSRMVLERLVKLDSQQQI